MSLTYTTLSMVGGLNTTTPSIDSQQGECLVLNNFEFDSYGNYKRNLGFERFDGRPQPHKFKYTLPTDFPIDGDPTTLIAAETLTGREDRRALIQPICDPTTKTALGGCVTDAGDIYAISCVTNTPVKLDMHLASSGGWVDKGDVAIPSATVSTQEDIDKIVIQAHMGRVLNSQPRTYITSGVTKCFYMDDTHTPVPIANTGADALDDGDLPIFALTHGDRLWLAYRGGRLMGSVIGEEDFDGAKGAVDFQLEDDITALSSAHDAIIIHQKRRTDALYGYTKTDMKMSVISTTIGAVKTSVAAEALPMFINAGEVNTLSRVQEYGDFAEQSVSGKVDNTLRGRDHLIIGAYAIKESNQYRVLYSDGIVLNARFQGGSVIGFSMIDYNLITSPKYSSGISQSKTTIRKGSLIYSNNGTTERVFVVSSASGFMFELDVGFSYDGEVYRSILRTHNVNFGKRYAQTNKKFKKLNLELTTNGNVEFDIIPSTLDVSYPEHDVIHYKNYQFDDRWSECDWNESHWNKSAKLDVPIYLYSRGLSLSMQIISDSNVNAPFIINAITVHFKITNRRR